MIIVPSMLAADPARLGDECRALADAGADRLQWDVMDGRFVPVVTVGPATIAACRSVVDVPFEAHLMVLDPEDLVPQVVRAGCDLVIVHAEACRHLHRTLGTIRDLGARAGVALNPATPADAVAHVLDETDLVLVMTVNPGFGGQRYIRAMEPKIAAVRSMVGAHGGGIEIEVDGGITDETIGGAASAGADVFISGSWLSSHPDGRAAGIAALRKAAGS